MKRSRGQRRHRGPICITKEAACREAALADRVQHKEDHLEGRREESRKKAFKNPTGCIFGKIVFTRSCFGRILCLYDGRELAKLTACFFHVAAASLRKSAEPFENLRKRIDRK